MFVGSDTTSSVELFLASDLTRDAVVLVENNGRNFLIRFQNNFYVYFVIFYCLNRF